jgi:hypothetical protein
MEALALLIFVLLVILAPFLFVGWVIVTVVGGGGGGGGGGRGKEKR